MIKPAGPSRRKRKAVNDNVPVCALRDYRTAVRFSVRRERGEVTTEEHILLLHLFFKQQQAIRILLDMLRSRGVLTDDDEKAFAAAQMQNAGSNAAIFAEMKANYLKIARAAGVETGLEQLPDPPEDAFQVK